jgi:hypothetical protein
MVGSVTLNRKIMKNKLKTYYSILFLIIGIFSCEKNEIHPDWTRLGSSNPTVASVTASKTNVVSEETIVLTIKYVNLKSDPASKIEIVERIGTSGLFSDPVSTLDESSAEKDAEITKHINYVVPSLTSNSTIHVDVLIYSQVEYPKRVRVALSGTP